MGIHTELMELLKQTTQLPSYWPLGFTLAFVFAKTGADGAGMANVTGGAGIKGGMVLLLLLFVFEGRGYGMREELKVQGYWAGGMGGGGGGGRGRAAISPSSRIALRRRSGVMEEVGELALSVVSAFNASG